MKSSLSLMLSSTLLFGVLVGCNKAESPAEVRQDVAEARQDAAENVATAQQNVAQDLSQTTETLAEGTRELSFTVAEGEYKIAVEKCEALGGDSQQACKERAEAALNLAKATAKSREAGTVQ